eukprot:TRINITY_DN16457_c0_g1_i1.p1 TRINITY_DN16457_c0_g1~~TRINITY_DN16457_c0_g1_i1.p1  ORF type:complete len:279 (+),score=32.90 TRINITY_DN16457_c0_g1_i1:29-865(+)
MKTVRTELSEMRLPSPEITVRGVVGVTATLVAWCLAAQRLCSTQPEACPDAKAVLSLVAAIVCLAALVHRRYCGGNLLPEPARPHRSSLCVVVDVDETIVYARDEDRPLQIRPLTAELFKTLSAHGCEVVLWTAGSRHYAESVAQELARECAEQGAERTSVVDHIVSRSDGFWYEDNVKDLRRLGRDLDRVVMVENCEENVRANTRNAIVVPSYEGGDEPGAPLRRVAAVVRRLAASDSPVPEQLGHCAELRRGGARGAFHLSDNPSPVSAPALTAQE